ncbi:serine hydrolase domain-containing protein [Flagellimonas aequoris]|uniref:Beta-lactamase family protein n=1 Tax=Flagellimonas aequoris TaxID=2306997 RepID=A0A418N977_9FLAO|nr:serine hydrolase domain-containing protein [Allomuricauda aequoris]RIV71562.1 class A beta-lactamase-related serine hydrolase [Allomuricauda aequoris]TXK03126.1 beta-lactamase family protein [Allomuricauda aequoris]
MTHKSSLLFLITIFSMAPFIGRGFQSPPSLDHNFQEMVQSALDSLYNEDEDFGGATLGIVLPNGASHAFAVGYADMDTKAPMRPDHMMLGGSTGKIFVSAAIMQQIEQKNIELDKDIQYYLGDKKWFDRIQNHKSITIRNLMQHSSGISRYVFTERFLSDVAKDPDRFWTPQELLSYVFDLPPLFEAGTDFSYSDTNYIILALVLEEVTGKTLYEYVDSNILAPYRLKNVQPQLSRKIPNLPTGYNGTKDPFYPGTVTKNGVYQYNLQFEWAGGGYVVNVLDLAKAGKLIYENQIFKADLMPEFLKGIDAKELGGQWGLGVHVSQIEGVTTYGHSGFFPGYITNMVYFPRSKVGIAFQVNVSDRERLGLYRKLTQLVPRINKLALGHQE